MAGNLREGCANGDQRIRRPTEDEIKRMLELADLT